MIKEEFEELLKLNWSSDEINLIKNIESNINYYKKFLPKQTKECIIEALRLSKKVKIENEELKVIIKKMKTE